MKFPQICVLEYFIDTTRCFPPHHLGGRERAVAEYISPSENAPRRHTLLHRVTSALRDVNGSGSFATSDYSIW